MVGSDSSICGGGFRASGGFGGQVLNPELWVLPPPVTVYIKGPIKGYI